MQESGKRQSILPVFMLVFIEMIGVGLVIPLLAPLFLDNARGLLGASVSMDQRVMLLGLLLASFSIAQFFGAPILGALSDRHGRKPIMLLSLVGSTIGYAIFGFGVLLNSLELLFIGRLLDGFVGGSVSVAYSAIADLSNEKEKAKNFGLIGMAFGLGFIIGPFLGGKLADSSVVPWFNFSTPFFATALLSIVNIVLVVFMFKETLSQKSNAKVSVLTGFRNLKKAFGMPSLRVVFMVVFLFSFGFSFFAQFSQVWLIEAFRFTEVQIGEFFAYIGFWIAFTQGVLTRPVSSRFKPEQVLRLTPLMLSIALFGQLFVTSPDLLYLAVPFVSIFQGLTFPNYSALVSNLAGKESQGEIFGISQSIQSIAMFLPPLISGFIAALHPALPVAASAFFVFCGWLLFTAYYHHRKGEIFHEV